MRRRTRRRAAPRRASRTDSLRLELRREVRAKAMLRWNAEPEDVERSLAKLVLTLCEFLRRLMERQAIRRMEAETLTSDEIEAVGLALMRLEETIRRLAAQFDLSPEEFGLELGPLGRLM